MSATESLRRTAVGDADPGVPASAPGAASLDILERNLRFALDGEGVDLSMLAPLVRAADPHQIAAIVRRRTTGVFARRLWYLYEWMTGRKLDVPESEGRLQFALVVDPSRQLALKIGTPSGRHRVIDNLPGTPRFCPCLLYTSDAADDREV